MRRWLKSEKPFWEKDGGFVPWRCVKLLIFIINNNIETVPAIFMIQSQQTLSSSRISPKRADHRHKNIPISPINLEKHLSLPQPFKRESFVNRNRDSSINFDHLKDFSILDTINPNEEFIQDPKIIRLAYTQKNKIICEKEPIKIFRHYKRNPIVFVGIYGREKAGKSYWLDKTLNLAKIQGNWHCNANSQDDPACIQFFGTPFYKGNLKLFFLDCTGFKEQNLTNEEKMRLDMMMTLSSMVIVMPEPSDREGEMLRIAYDHFSQCQQRLMMEGKPTTKNDSHWPQTLYCLYRGTKPVKKELQKVGELFSDYNFSIIHDYGGVFNQNQIDMLKEQVLESRQARQNYLNKVQVIYEDIYLKLRPKEFGQLKSNGLVLTALVPQLKNSLAVHKKQQLSTIFDNTIKTLYAQKEREMQDLYDSEINRNFRHSKIMSTKRTLQMLKDTRQKVYRQFDKETSILAPRSKHHRNHEKYLEKYMSNEQQKFMTIQTKQALNQLEKKLPEIENIQNSEKGLQYLDNLKHTQKRLDYEGRSGVIGKNLKLTCDHNKNKFFVTEKEFQEMEKLESEIKDLNTTYSEVEKQKRDLLIKYQEKQDEEKFLKQKNQRLKESILMYEKLKEVDQEDGEENEKRKIDIWAQKKAKLEETKKRTENMRKKLLEQLRGDQSIKKSLIISKLNDEIEDEKQRKRNFRRKLQQKISYFNRIQLSAAEKRQIKENKNIKKSRLK